MTAASPATETEHADARAWLGGALGLALVLVALGWVLNLPMAVGVALFNEQPMAVALGLALALAAVTAIPAGFGRPGTALGIMAAAVLLGIAVVLALRFPQLQILAIMRPVWLTAMTTVLLVGLLALVWRHLGFTIVAIVGVFSALALWGGTLGIPQTASDRFAVYMATDANAILGLPLKVAVQIVIPFVLFGELLRLTGGGEYMTRLCLSAFGRFRGGSAKAAVGASAVFGTISGNAVSNVAGTGIVTIPLMTRTGMPPHTAAALEASASTGGQLLPPVMGAAAFVMADYLRVPYLEVAAAAALPAFLYFAAILIQVDRIAARDGTRRLRDEEIPRLGDVAWAGIHFIVPFVVLFVVLWRNQTRPELAAIAATATLALVTVLRPFEGRRLSPRVVIAALADTGRSAAPLLLVTAAAGMIIGLISLTGLGFSIAADAIAASGGNLIVLLALVAVIAILFGMGMPTVAVYVVLATILTPALTQMGLSGMQAHMFILYFGMMSMLTPPVALASITAAKIAGAGIWQTSFAAVRLAWVAYIIPILFAFSPELLLRGSPGASLLAAATALVGTAAISCAAVGFARTALGPAMRLAFLLAGAALLLPHGLGAWAGGVNVAGALALIILFIRNSSAMEELPNHDNRAATPAGE